MKEQLISFETAKLAKEKGFYIEPEDDYSMSFFNIEGGRWTMFQTKRQTKDYIKKEYNKAISYALITTQSLLQRWIRENHEIILSILSTIETCTYGSDDDGDWREEIIYKIHIYRRRPSSEAFYTEYEKNDFDSYEEALEVGLQEALKLIK